MTRNSFVAEVTFNKQNVKILETSLMFYTNEEVNDLIKEL